MLLELGQKVGRSRVNMFGAKVINEKLERSHWVRRHDMVKSEINSLCSYAGLPAECEAYGVFSSLVPQQPLNRLERHRTRQVLRPAARLSSTSTGSSYWRGKLPGRRREDYWSRRS